MGPTRQLVLPPLAWRSTVRCLAISATAAGRTSPRLAAVAELPRATSCRRPGGAPRDERMVQRMGGGGLRFLLPRRRVRVKPRLLSSQTTTSHTSTSNATTPRSFDTTSGHQDASFRDSLPRHVRAPAVFKCVRVTSIEDGEDEYAYQVTVTINGHLFKGFLYDQGLDDGRHAATSNDDSTAGVPNISELHLGAASGSGGVREGGTSMAPTELYGTGGHHPHILGGSSSYGNTMS